MTKAVQASLDLWFYCWEQYRAKVIAEENNFSMAPRLIDIIELIVRRISDPLHMILLSRR